MKRVLVVDNYDSFTYNLVQLLVGLTDDFEVVRNDAIDLSGVIARSPTHIILSPGPGRPETPRDFGVCSRIVQAVRDEARPIPLLGVCLGHQGIAYGFGAAVTRAPKVMHGKTSLIQHDGTGLFQGLKQPTEMMRYHSLTVAADSLPDELTATAFSEDGLLMALSHKTKPIFGVQFHPESIASPDGRIMMENFIQTSRAP